MLRRSVHVVACLVVSGWAWGCTSEEAPRDAPAGSIVDAALEAQQDAPQEAVEGSWDADVGAADGDVCEVGADGLDGSDGSPGGCLGEVDQSILRDATKDVDSTAWLCGWRNMNQTLATRDCIAATTGTSEECAGCFAALARCRIERCAYPCESAPPADAECAKCIADKPCDDEFAKCSGIQGTAR